MWESSLVGLSYDLGRQKRKIALLLFFFHMFHLTWLIFFFFFAKAILESEFLLEVFSQQSKPTECWMFCSKSLK